MALWIVALTQQPDAMASLKAHLKECRDDALENLLQEDSNKWRGYVLALDDLLAYLSNSTAQPPQKKT